MKTIPLIFRWVPIALLAVASVSCMPAYDAEGRPVQAVDPVVATAGIAAAGLIGYAVGNSNNRYRSYGGGYYGSYYGPYYGPHCYY